MMKVEFQRISPAISEPSVTGPMKTQIRAAWRNSEAPYSLPAAHIEKIKKMPLTVVPSRPQPPAPPPKKLWSLGRKMTALAGILCCTVGVLGGLFSIVALGPVGLAVAAGAAILGACLIKAAAK